MARKAKPKAKVESTSDALNAVEEALKIDFGLEAEADGLEDNAPEAPEPAAKEEAPRREQVVSPSSAPANDVRRSGAARFAATLNKKPSAFSFWVAAFLSIVWIVAAFWAGYSIIGDSITDLAAWSGIADRPNLIYFAASLILPLMLIWSYALMSRRGQELKIAARSMTEVAYRLIEPENEASGAVRSVGQAVRVEVNALTDGIERAMARASELEALVHNEVSTLENSYSENELRMRGLVEELSNAKRSSTIPNVYVLQSQVRARL